MASWISSKQFQPSLQCTFVFFSNLDSIISIFLGKETALQVAKKGGTVEMICRSEERGKEAQEEIMKESGSEDVHLHIVDMSQPSNVHKFAESYVRDGKPVHVLVNNAGCMVNDRTVSEDGLEKNFATNTLGTYLLTAALIDH